MESDLHKRIRGMLWDLPGSKRVELAKRIVNDAVTVFHEDEQVFLKALNSLKWHELIRLTGKEEFFSLLTDSTIRKLFPPERRIFYTNARRLLSKYCIPSTGQGT
jgi:hypothetical protein